MKRIIGIILLTALLAALALSVTSCSGAAYKEDKDGVILAEEGNTHMLGRTYVQNFRKVDKDDHNGDGKALAKYDSAMFFNWPASGFEVSFNGTGLKAQILSGCGGSGESHVMVYVLVDGDDEPDNSKMIEIEYVDGWYTLCENLENGEHTVKVIRRDSMDTGSGARTTAIRAYDVLGGNTMNAAPAPSQYRIEAFGDSITCGDELYLIGYEENGQRISQADGWQTYEAYVARQFDADLSVVSISGNGLICSLMGGKFLEIPDRFYNTDEFCSKQKNDWDHSKYNANLVLINLGTNDCAGVPNNYSYEEFEQAYVDFASNIKDAYPECHIIAMLGMMGGREKVWPSIENAAARINEKYGEGTMYTLWLEVEGISDSPVQGGGHPSAEAQAKAGEIISELCEKEFGWTRAEKYQK